MSLFRFIFFIVEFLPFNLAILLKLVTIDLCSRTSTQKVNRSMVFTLLRMYRLDVFEGCVLKYLNLGRVAVVVIV